MPHILPLLVIQPVREVDIVIEESRLRGSGGHDSYLEGCQLELRTTVRASLTVSASSNRIFIRAAPEACKLSPADTIFVM